MSSDRAGTDERAEAIMALGRAAGRLFELALAQHPLAVPVGRSLEAGRATARLVVDFSPELVARGEIVADGAEPVVLFTVDGRGRPN